MDDLIAYDTAGDLSESIQLLGRDAVDLVIERIRILCQGIGTGLMLLVGGGLLWTWTSFLAVFIAMRSGNLGLS